MAAAPQFSPVQVLSAGRRAEADGNFDHAEQFYRHIVRHYASSAEAEDALEGLARLARTKLVALEPDIPAAVDSAEAPAPAGTGIARADDPLPRSLADTVRPGPRAYGHKPVPAGGRGYGVGRALANTFRIAGWLLGALGLALIGATLSPPPSSMQPALLVLLGPWSAGAAAAACIAGGLALVLVAEVARAVFDIAVAHRASDEDHI
jgi:hypothetical protein